jgi:hypothetical protein
MPDEQKPSTETASTTTVKTEGQQPQPTPPKSDRFEDWARLLLASLAVLSLWTLVILWSTHKTLLPENVIVFVTGQLFGIVITCYGFWFNTSSGSVAKSRMMDKTQ